MTRAYNLDTGCQIRVYIPGPPGPPRVDVGLFTAPVLVDGGTIAAPVNRWQRSFIQAAIGPLNQPIIPNPSDNGTWIWEIYNVGGYPIIINNAANIKLSGQSILSPDSILSLEWDTVSRWVEAYRNEI